MRKNREIEKRCLEQLEIDYMPIHDIVREFAGFDGSLDEGNFLEAMAFLRYFSRKHDLDYLEGPEMRMIDQSPEKIVENLEQRWRDGQYEDVNYKIWLSK